MSSKPSSACLRMGPLAARGVHLLGSQPYSRKAPDGGGRGLRFLFFGLVCGFGFFLHLPIFAKANIFGQEFRGWGNRACYGESVGSLTRESSYCSVYEH